MEGSGMTDKSLGWTFFMLAIAFSGSGVAAQYGSGLGLITAGVGFGFATIVSAVIASA
jgi:uncharacterized membrane protein